MKAKLTFIAGLATGYVLGTRAGRGSYEKIKASAQSFWAKDAVQETVTTVQDAIKDQAGEAAHKLVEQAKHIRSSDSADSEGADQENADSHTPGPNPLDIVPEVSDEFPDAGLNGGEGQNWGGKDGLSSRN